MNLNKMAALILALGAIAGSALGAETAPVPEIDGNFAASAVALAAGGLLILRSRRK